MFIVSPYRFVSLSVGDFSNVMLQLHLNGTNGSTANAIDSSDSPKTITLNSGGTLSNIQQKFGATSFKTAGHMRLAGNQGLTTATGDFTLEAWIYPTAAGYGEIFCKSLTTGYWQWRLEIDPVSKLQARCYDNVTPSLVVNLISPSAMTLNAWSHVAFVRSGSSFKLFLNGALVDSSTFSGSLRTADEEVGIGACENGAATFAGYIDEVRISNVAQYTAAFTPSASPFPDSTITDANFADVSLLLHMNGSAGSTTFTDVAGNIITPNGGAQLSTTQSKFGGASFRGVSQYLTIADSTPLTMNTGDFTIEMWVWFDTSAGAYILYNKAAGTGFYPTQLWFDTNSHVAFRGFDDAGPTLVYNILGSTAVTANTWHHVAAVRDGSTFRLFLDGVSQGTATSGATLYTPTNPIAIGAYNNGVSPLLGYIDEVRVTKGVARYTANFTPPTAPFPNRV
jgi:hypothetical protein